MKTRPVAQMEPRYRVSRGTVTFGIQQVMRGQRRDIGGHFGFRCLVIEPALGFQPRQHVAAARQATLVAGQVHPHHDLYPADRQMDRAG